MKYSKFLLLVADKIITYKGCVEDVTKKDKNGLVESAWICDVIDSAKDAEHKQALLAAVNKRIKKYKKKTRDYGLITLTTIARSLKQDPKAYRIAWLKRMAYREQKKGN